MIARGIKPITSLPKSIRLSLAVFGTGIASGLVGILCHYLLKFIQILVFGNDKSDLLSQFDSVSPFRRFAALLVVGVLASLFWYFLQRRVSLLSISKSKQLVGKKSPNFLGQSLHALMQVAIVGAGSSIGKEGAPRELGALFGGNLSKALHLDIVDRQLLIACGAGAGLAAVYQVPFASTLFVLETLGVAWKSKNIVIIFVTTYLSAYCARPIVGKEAMYQVGKVSSDPASLIQVIVLVLVITPLAMMFSFLAKKASKSRITDKRILWTMPLSYVVLGGIAAFYPLIMGNGQVLAQWLFSGGGSAYLPLILVVKGLMVCLLLWAGSYGGTLTPSFTLGAGLGFLLTSCLEIFGLSLNPTLGMLLGATVFLGITLDAHLTGIALVLGFTGQGGLVAVPLILASLLSRILKNRWKKKTMNIHFILHETFEVPGAYLKWAQDRGHNITSTKVYEEELLPETVEGIDFLIVMGGPQSPDEDRQAFPYYDPEAEIAFMQKAIAVDIYIVGVCLGAQLLSVAYGGKYEHSPEREIGVFPVTLTAAGLADEHVKGFGETLNTGHWHGDMPGLTDNAVVLATSQGCPRQIIRFSPKHYAFQAHLEFDPEAIDLLIAADGEEHLRKQNKDLPFVQTPEQLRANDYSEMNKKLYDFLDSLTQA